MGVQFYVPIDTQILAVTGASTLASTSVTSLNASGASTLANTSVTSLSASNLITASNGINVTGSTVVQALQVSGSTIVQALNVEGQVNLDHNINVGENINVIGNVNVGGDIHVNTLHVTGMTTAPTALDGTTTTQIATTEFVHNSINIFTTVSPNTLTLLDTLSSALAADTGPNGVQNGIIKVVTDEKSRAETAESSLNSSISAEVTRANNAESSLNSSITAEFTRANNAESVLRTNLNTVVTLVNNAEGLFAPKTSPTFTGNVTLSTGNIVLNSKDVGKGLIQFAARDTPETVPYFMGVDANGSNDKLVIKKGDDVLMSISDNGYSDASAVDTVTFSAPVLITDILDLTSAGCKIKLSSTQYITKTDLLAVFADHLHTF